MTSTADPTSPETVPQAIKPARILVVDDDPKLCRLIKSYLEPKGYRVAAVHTGDDGLAQAIDAAPDAVILDVMLPGMDGFDVLRSIRRQSQVPVLMLTGRGAEADRVTGLNLGADDYLPKTFSPRELLARLQAVLRRVNQSADSSQPELVNGPLTVIPDDRQAPLEGALLELNPLEYDLLLGPEADLTRVSCVAEGIDDLRPFEASNFARALVGQESDAEVTQG